MEGVNVEQMRQIYEVMKQSVVEGLVKRGSVMNGLVTQAKVETSEK